MIAVLFEVWPDDAETYLDLAGSLRAELDGMDGFLTIERFESLSDPGKLLSLSFWRDEAAVAGWRNGLVHRTVQAKGRAGVFRDYRLRIAAVVRDYGMHDRNEAPPDSRAVHG
ncbi:antibiotic biosynthesis monooxygenase [Sphingosinicella sp. BN140058]|uniref:antibiotic biosynthesis monooxygenase family protein n=1 Tax=Sphingosinicella sp. BN140058 TaxID=1892855 RepID=UPI001010B249|nr:antibiotic biosynthesis monooxygenase [Sphingosinicella sp. BN140058]QAY77851.1 antibiotic biosynthesis monooxygenase [Sphingosinicella sp. BN140058]